jgi:diguanylate cyclase (GGDEF)-like protein
MYDLQAGDRLLARRRFHEWLAILQLDFTLENIALLLVSGDGTVIVCESGFDDATNRLFSKLQEGNCYQLDSTHYQNNGIVFTTAAAPIQPESPNTSCWLVMLVMEPFDMLLRVHKLLVSSFSKYWLKPDPQLACEVNAHLFDMASSFFGKIDVGDVITETASWLEKRFSTQAYDLLLSQDHRADQYPVKQLNIVSPESDISSKAYIEGQYAIQYDVNEVKVAAPLKGEQGIYGVIHLTVNGNFIKQDDIAYLVALSKYAGSSFEVAKLYEQSTKLVDELRMINEITKRLNKSLQLSEIFYLAAMELLHAFTADYCCILMIDQDRKSLVVRASNAIELINEKFDVQYGFSGLILHSEEPVIISDYQYDKHVESKLMKLTKAKSLIGSPIKFGAETVGAILLAHTKTNYFSFDNFKLLQVLSSHVSLAVNNATLHAEMRRMVITDQLTGLFVRHHLYEQIELQQKTEACGSLIVLDIDDFKAVNDTFGHQIGDKVLIQVSDIVKRSIRESDIAARWGGEELAIYLPLMAIEQAYRVAERIRNLIASQTQPRVTVSSGIADWMREEAQIDVDHLFHDADQALYEAKNSGKNQIRIRGGGR